MKSIVKVAGPGYSSFLLYFHSVFMDGFYIRAMLGTGDMEMIRHEPHPRRVNDPVEVDRLERK